MCICTNPFAGHALQTTSSGGLCHPSEGGGTLLSLSPGTWNMSLPVRYVTQAYFSLSQRSSTVMYKQQSTAAPNIFPQAGWSFASPLFLFHSLPAPRRQHEGQVLVFMVQRRPRTLFRTRRGQFGQAEAPVAPATRRSLAAPPLIRPAHPRCTACIPRRTFVRPDCRKFPERSHRQSSSSTISVLYMQQASQPPPPNYVVKAKHRTAHSGREPLTRPVLSIQPSTV